MRSILGCWSLLALAAIGGAACGDATAGDLFPGDASVAVLPALGGRGGRGGLPGRGGGGGGGASGEPDAGAGEAGSGTEPSCTDGAECADGNPCTEDTCVAGVCVREPLAAGAECGSAEAGECSRPDSCDGSGACLPNDESDGVACSGGACGAGVCVPEEEPTSECPAAVASTDTLPFEASWRTVGGVDLYGGTCDERDTPDFAVVFTALQGGVYRFEAAGVAGDADPETPGSELADSVLTVAAGSCAGAQGAQLGCNDDAGDTFDSQLDLVLEAGQVVTVYVGEYAEVVPGGGSGTLRIRRLSGED